MKKRKLQIFVSSTYEDLVDYRLAAIEAILAAGHIPAAMEQFSAGDETASEKIRTWIEESDGFILILGGRYGSIEPQTGKSYVEREYEYALELKKPFFSLVVSDQHHEERVKRVGFEVDERAHRDQYTQFKSRVTQRVCRFWSDRKDIQTAIFQKLPEWAHREDLVGWIRGNEAPAVEVTNELARLSQENREMRSQLAKESDKFNGLSFEQLVEFLREQSIPQDLSIPKPEDLPDLNFAPTNAGELFELLHDSLSASGFVNPQDWRVFDPFLSFGLVQCNERTTQESYPEYWIGQYQMRLTTTVTRTFTLTESGRLFRNRLLLLGSREERLRAVWKTDTSGQRSSAETA